jgi:hypothetical protein
MNCDFKTQQPWHLSPFGIFYLFLIFSIGGGEKLSKYNIDLGAN